MGYFDGLVDGSFKTTGDGGLLFYPFGILGKGYTLPNLAKKHEIRRRLKRFVIIMCLTIIPLASLLGPSILFFSIPWWISAAIYLTICSGWSFAGYIVSKRCIKGLTPVNIKLTVAESYKNSARSHNMFVLLGFEIASLLFIVGGVWMIFDSRLAWYFRLDGALCIIFFGFCSAAIGYMIKVKTEK